MPKPLPSQFTNSSDYHTAVDLWHTKLHGFSLQVDQRVEEQYDLSDGGDLCYNLLDSGVIPESSTVDEAARIVAMHLMQA